ncbi:MAG: DapH/DapD/GlmU-related protein [bacterium]
MSHDLSQFDDTFLKKIESQRSVLSRLLWQAVKIFFRAFPIIPGKLYPSVLRLFGAKLGKNVVIRSDVDILYPFNLEVGDQSLIEAECYVACYAPVKIGSNVAIATRTVIMNGTHRPFDPKFTVIAEPITIEDGVWIGCNSTILGGVTIHQSAVIGAASLINKDVPPYTLVGGVPARPIKRFDPKEKRIIDLKSSQGNRN